MSERAARKETANVVWSGSWVAERLGVELVGNGAPGGDGELRELLGLALRRNPKRAHLLVSNVLGKHVPQRPSVVYGAGFELGLRVRELLGEAPARRSVVLGYAETATGLGHAVADGLGVAPYLHSTRRPVEGVVRAGGFEESHSHATSHLLLPEDPTLLGTGGEGRAGEPLVLVDDEFSTGNTVLNTIRALHELYPRDRYVIVALVDMRSPADRGRLTEFAAEIGARVDLVARGTGTVRLPDGVLEKGRRWSPPMSGPPRPATAWLPQPGPDHRYRGERPTPSAPEWSWGGRPGCPTAAGTASPPHIARPWNRPFRPWPPASPTPWTATPAAYWSSASRS